MTTTMERLQEHLDSDEIEDAIMKNNHDCHLSPEDGCPICEENLLNEHASRVGGDE